MTSSHLRSHSVSCDDAIKQVCMHTREKLPLSVELSMNLNANGQLPAIRARVTGRNISTMLLIFGSLILKLLVTERTRSFGNVTRVKAQEWTRRADVDFSQAGDGPV